MTIAFGLWSLELTPGKVQLVIPPADIRITNVALGDTLVDASGRSTVKLTYNPFGGEDDEEDEEEDSDERTTVLCSLTAGKFEHTTTDIVLEKNGGFHFELVGKNSVYLSGNYIDQESIDNPPYGESDLASDDEGDLDELASDVDMDSDDVTDASRFEELDEEAPQKLKRGRESDHIDFKAEKKNKKLKADNGQAVPSDAGKKESAPEAKHEKKDKGGEKASEKKGEQKAEKKEKKKENKDESVEDKKSKPTEKELSGGIKVLDSTVGTGSTAKKGSTVSMRYIGKLQNGKIFDKNVKGKPFTFRLGQGEVIKGWDEGIVGMQVGGERKLTIPPNMGYGKKGTDGIPPNSTLIFEVKLIEIK